MDPKNKEHFRTTRKKTQAEDKEEYVKFWFDKFELISFLYYGMQKEFRVLYPALYSIGTQATSFQRKTKKVKPKATTKIIGIGNASTSASLN